jgi:CheY-like chemotaxis protein
MRGFQVVTAFDGLQGVALAREERPDLILMDISLPEIDGWEATRRIRQDPSTATIPIIAVTAHVMAGAGDLSFAAGCNEFEPKPIDIDRLLAKIDILLGLRGTR